MAQPRNRLPEQENERVINETLRRAALRFAPLGETTTSVGGGGGSGGGNQTPYVPTVIPDGQTFTVPEDTQVLWAVPIDVEGTLDIQGSFVMVN